MEGRKEGRKGGRKEGRREGGKKGRKEGMKEVCLVCEFKFRQTKEMFTISLNK